MTPDKHFVINNSLDILQARREGMDLATTIGFSKTEAIKIAVVISELGRNIATYVGNGSIKLFTAPPESDRHYIKIIAEDEGDGIADIDAAIAQNGMGLAGSQRLMDEFEIVSIQGEGTQITAIKWLD